MNPARAGSRLRMPGHPPFSIHPAHARFLILRQDLRWPGCMPPPLPAAGPSSTAWTCSSCRTRHP